VVRQWGDSETDETYGAGVSGVGGTSVLTCLRSVRDLFCCHADAVNKASKTAAY